MRALPTDPFGSIAAPRTGTIFVPASARVAPRLPRWAAQSTSVAEHPRCENRATRRDSRRLSRFSPRETTPMRRSHASRRGPRAPSDLRELAKDRLAKIARGRPGPAPNRSGPRRVECSVTALQNRLAGATAASFSALHLGSRDSCCQCKGAARDTRAIRKRQRFGSPRPL